MSTVPEPRRPLPWWMKTLVIAAMLPLVLLPQLIAACPPSAPEMTFLRFYPVYVLAAGICAWLSYGRRPEVTWIILALLILTHAAMWLLVNPL
jgi:hypothetical protein